MKAQSVLGLPLQHCSAYHDTGMIFCRSLQYKFVRPYTVATYQKFLFMNLSAQAANFIGLFVENMLFGEPARVYRIGHTLIVTHC